MRAVNLLPADARPGRTPIMPSSTSVAVVGAGLLAAVTAFLAVLLVQGHSTVSDKRDKLEALQAQVAQVQAAQARTAAQQGSDRARVAAFAAAASARMPWDNLLDDVSRVLPDGSWISTLNLQTGVPEGVPSGTTPTTTTTVPTGFTVSGIALTQDIVALVMRRLELVPALSDVTLQSSTRTAVGTSKAFQFTMSANVRLPEVPK